MRGRTTYWHLESARRKPSDYDVVTSRLLYHTERGFAVDSSGSAWYQRFQQGSLLRVRDWEAFRDPRETTYARYVERQRTQETFVDGLFATVDLTARERATSDERLSAAWVEHLDDVLPVLRYPGHALQMVSGYLGCLAPATRIAVAFSFRAADEMRRVQRVSYRAWQMARLRPGFAARALGLWERDPTWQPLRRIIEQLLVTYDWGEALVAQDLVIKPMFDSLFMVRFAALAAERGDDVLASMCFSLAEDCRWQRAMSAALLRVALDDMPSNRAVVGAWKDAWVGRARDPFQVLSDRFVPEAVAYCERTCRELWTDCGLEGMTRV
jgi:toluene monooxygenase system protein E